MRKKIILLLIFIVSFIGFGIEVRATEGEYDANKDFSLFYSIDEFTSTGNSTIEMNGWTFFHNYNQCGNGDCKRKYYSDYGKYTQDITEIIKDLHGKGKNDYDSEIKYIAYYQYCGSKCAFRDSGYYYPFKLRISIIVKSTDGSLQYRSYCDGVDAGCSEDGIKFEYIDIDLFTWMCNGNPICTGHITSNVGFKVSVDLSKLDKGKSYNFYIKADLYDKDNNHIKGEEKQIGISPGVFDNNLSISKDSEGRPYYEYSLSNGSKLTITNIDSKVRNRNNPVSSNSEYGLG